MRHKKVGYMKFAAGGWGYPHQGAGIVGECEEKEGVEIADTARGG